MKKALLLLTAMSFLSVPQVSYAGLFEDLGVSRITKQYNSSANIYRINIYTGGTKIEVHTGTSGQSVWTVLNTAIENVYADNGITNVPDYAYADAAAAMAATSDRTITVADLNAAPIGATVDYNSRTYEKRMAGNQIAWYSHVSGNHYTTDTVDAIAQGASNLSSLNVSRYKDEGTPATTATFTGFDLLADGKPEGATAVQDGETWTIINGRWESPRGFRVDRLMGATSRTWTYNVPASGGSFSPDFTGTIPDAPTVTGSFYLNAEFAGGEQRGFFARDFPVGTHIRWGPNASYEATVAIVNGQKTWQGSASARTGFNTSTRLYANIPTGNDAPGANPNWRTANPAPIHIPANTTWSTDYPVGTTLTLSGTRTWNHGIRTATLELVDGRKQWRVRFGNGQVAGIPGSSTAASTIDAPWGAYRHNWRGVIDISSGVNPTGGFANVDEYGSADNYNIDRDNENYRRIFHYEKDGVAAGGFNVLRDYLNANNVYYDRFRFAIAEAYEDGFEEGYEDGWEEGYEDGYELGYQHGFADARETN